MPFFWRNCGKIKQERKAGGLQAGPNLWSPLAVSDFFLMFFKVHIWFYVNISTVFVSRTLSKSQVQVHAKATSFCFLYAEKSSFFKQKTIFPQKLKMGKGY